MTRLGVSLTTGLTLVLDILLMLPKFNQAFQNHSTCGEQTGPLAGEPAIFGGKPAQEGEWPWQARLYSGGGQIGACGASLIDPEWILTAAHCLQGALDRPDLFEFRMGSNSIIGDGPNQQSRVAEAIFMHPNYSIGELSDVGGNDVALLKLTEPFNITDYVRTVCLPTASMAEDFPAGTLATVTGWGMTSEEYFSGDLLEVTVLITNQSDCEDLYGSGGIPISESMLCAGEPTKGFCSGDSGGPLVFKMGDRWFQLGVVSFTFTPCGISSNVYMRMSAFEDWIAPIFEGGQPTRQDSNCKSSDMINCRYGGCIPQRMKCNGQVACLSRSDEENCDQLPPPAGLTTTAKALIGVFSSLGGLVIIGLLVWGGVRLNKRNKLRSLETRDRDHVISGSKGKTGIDNPACSDEKA